MRLPAVVVVVLAWVAAALLSLEVARRTTSGPVVLRLTEDHGVHAGDAVAVLAGTSLAVVVTLAARRLRGR